MFPEREAPAVVAACNRSRRRDVDASVQTRSADQPSVQIRRVHALVNPASGGVGPRSAADLEDLLAELGLDHRVSELTPGRFEAVTRAAIDGGPDLMVVLGGDGTARMVAEMCGPQGPMVAPLCGGTMNKLGRSLYGRKPWRQALVCALTRGEACWMPGGEVDGRSFYCSAMLGTPALWARAREAVRSHKLDLTWRHALTAARSAFQIRLDYEFDGEVGQGWVMDLICPTVSRALSRDDRILEMAVLDLPDSRSGFRLALANLIGDWRADPGVTVRPCLSARAWARDPIPAMLDGEFFSLGREVTARFLPRAFRALALATDANGHSSTCG